MQVYIIQNHKNMIKQIKKVYKQLEEIIVYLLDKYYKMYYKLYLHKVINKKQ